MEEYLRLLADGRVSLEGLGQETFPVDDADDGLRGAQVERVEAAARAPLVPGARRGAGSGRRGCGRWRRSRGSSASRSSARAPSRRAQHLPNLLKLRDHYELRAVMSRTGASAKAVAARAEAGYATTDLDEVLGDDAIDLVLISTRHDSHAALALRALEAGKHVFVEKPLALDEDELAAIEAFYADRADGPLLMTGFNRRFSPAAARLRELLAGRTSPLVANYRMNAGYIPLDHWVHGPEGGGRNIGEACHVYDLFDFLVERRARSSVQAQAIGAGEPALGGERQLRRHDRLRRRLGLHAHVHGARPPRPPEGAARRLRRRPRALARRLQVAAVDGGGDGWRVDDRAEGTRRGARGAGARAARGRPVADLARAAAAGDADQLRGRAAAEGRSAAQMRAQSKTSARDSWRRRLTTFRPILLLLYGAAMRIRNQPLRFDSAERHAVDGHSDQGCQRFDCGARPRGPAAPRLHRPLQPRLERASRELLPGVGESDDQGIYLYLPVLANLSGETEPPLMVKWLFTWLMALVVLVYPLVFAMLFRSVLAGILAPWPVIYGFDFLQNIDIYWISGRALLLCLPLVMLAAKREWWLRRSLSLLVAAAALAGVASSIRSHAGLPIAIAAAIVVLLRLRSWRSRALAVGSVAAVYILCSSLMLAGARTYRDRVTGVDFAAAANTTHPLWHPTYLGLGYLPNDYGITWNDTVALDAAEREQPGVVYLSRQYEETLRKLYFDIVRDDPRFVATTYWAKLRELLHQARGQFGLLLLLIPSMLFLGLTDTGIGCTQRSPCRRWW